MKKIYTKYNLSNFANKKILTYDGKKCNIKKEGGKSEIK